MRLLALLASIMLACMPTHADNGARLTQDTQAVKNAVLELNKDLYQLEQQLLSPATTQISFYFSLRGVKNFTPLALEINASGLPAIHHIYTERQLEALRMGAVQPVTSDNIGPGEHSVAIVVRGKDSKGYEQVLELQETVEKQSEPLLLEIALTDSQGGHAQVQLHTWH